MFAVVRSFLLALGQLLVIDAVFIGLCLLALVPLGMYNRAGYAVMKRNFVGYFSNPTGYVFLCVFVLLASFSAFWPHEFFNANLANLDQLNRYFPLVMLVFIPAITMSVWAEERRQGTDELLLTLPARDFDIVMGKYLAAASIYTCSLIFAQLSSYIVLISLTYGELDVGLLCATYFGYWLIGIAMIAIGMVASFLTSNLTVGFILGALFNAPLVFAMWADVIISSPSRARMLAQWSLANQFDDLGRGVLSLSSVAYFVMVVIAGLYLSMVLIGSRHWMGGRDGHSLGGHYLVRIIALCVLAVSLSVLLTNHNLRRDVTENKTSSLSPRTKQLISSLNPKNTIHIDAFVGSQIPEEYIKTRFELLSMLKEFESRSHGNIKITIQDNLEPFSKEAVQAERRYGIRPQPVLTRARGVIKEEPVILGAAITCGLEKVVVPFFDYGIPVEYELIRSVSTVAKSQRKKVGVVRTDAQLMGGFDMSGGNFRNLPREQIIDELEKQYEIEQVEPGSPIDVAKYDVLFVVQPSSLTQQELENVTQAVKQGVPAAIFEDPFPYMMRTVPGTGDPKRQNPMMSMMGGGGQPPPKGNIRMLWDALGIKVEGEDRGPGNYQSVIVWQRFNPYRKLQSQHFGDEWVFVSPDAPDATEPFNPADAITSGLEEVLFPFPGSVEANPDRTDLTFTPLVSTGRRSGTISPADFRANAEDPAQLQIKRGRPGSAKYALAARIQGKGDARKSNAGQSKDKDPDAKEGSSQDGKKDDSQAKPINVVYVADIDLLAAVFVRLRAQPEQDTRYHFENVTFVLNVIDALSGEEAFLDIRKRKSKYSTLKVIERQVDEARTNETQAREKFEEEHKEANRKAEDETQNAVKKFRDSVNELNEKARKGEPVDFGELKAKQDQLNIQQTYADQQLATKKERLKNENNEKIQEIRRGMDLKILTIQRWIKMLAVVIPPIPPLLIGLIVWVVLQLREREGISKARMR